MASNSDEGLQPPTWIEASLFEPVFKKIVGSYRQIKSFKAEHVPSTSVNYASVIFRLKTEIELDDGSSRELAFILKIPHSNVKFKDILKGHDVFDAEATMYREVIPEFEKLYRDVRMRVNFGPKYYPLDTDQNCILLEDLRPKGFINANRLEGLDMQHTHEVLKKMAQWHAVSAVRVDTKGQFPQNISHSYSKEENLPMMKAMFSTVANIRSNCLMKFFGDEVYHNRLLEQQRSEVERLYNSCKINSSDFNVLNHGDCWCTNVMFVYDDSGSIKDTCLLDFQMTKYGTPAQDLYYFLLSSTKYELKTTNFDHFIKYYYYQLVIHLKILDYKQNIPTLKDLHIMLHEHNIWALSTVSGVLASVLSDPSIKSSLENNGADADDGTELVTQMYANSRYRKHCELLYPWLYNRGAIY